MRHLKHRHQLGRKKEHREALMANLAVALITHGRIETTLPKAKALRPFVEKLITLAKKAHDAPRERALHLRRQAIAKLRDREAARLLFTERAGEFVNRPGGYTRIYKLGTRTGDAAEMAIIALIEAGDEGYGKRRGGGKTAEPAPKADVQTESQEAAGAAAAAAVATEEDEAAAELDAEASTEETPAEEGESEKEEK